MIFQIFRLACAITIGIFLSACDSGEPNRRNSAFSSLMSAPPQEATENLNPGKNDSASRTQGGNGNATSNISASTSSGAASNEVGHFDHASHSWLKGWACNPSAPSASVTVHFWATAIGSCQGNQLCFLGSVTANSPREKAVADNCGGNANSGFMLATPSALLDGKDHQIAAFAIDASGKNPLLSGQPIFNSLNLYEQEFVGDIDWNSLVFYTEAAKKSDSSLRDYFVNPSLNESYNLNITDRTIVPFWNSPANPLRDSLPYSLGYLTGLDGAYTPYSLWQRGVNGGVNGITALQMLGTSVGISLAPRALTSSPFTQSAIPGYNWPDSANIKPFSRSLDDRLHVQGYFKHPYTSVAPVGNHFIGEEGIVFFYYTLQFVDKNLGKSIWLTTRIYQDKYPHVSETAWPQLSNHEALTGDFLADPTHPLGLIDAILSPSSSRVTPCLNSSYFSLDTRSEENFYCFELSGNQLRSALTALNAANIYPPEGSSSPNVALHFSTDPKDYTLTSFNVNVESWAPTTASDPRIALSYRDVRIEQRHTQHAPSGFVGATRNNEISGWACDSDNYAAPVRVDFYATGTDGLPHATNCGADADGERICYVGTASANLQREQAVADNCGGNAFHGFNFTIPNFLNDGNFHKIYSKALDTPSDARDPATLVTDLIGSPNTIGSYRMAAISNDVLWPTTNAVDGNFGTAYSSQLFAAATNDRGTYLAAYLDGQKKVSTLLLRARMYKGEPQAFPKSYDIYLTSPDNSKWNYVGQFSDQPDASGVVNINLSGRFLTYGVLIVPRALGTDIYGGHYFQMSEVRLSF